MYHTPFINQMINQILDQVVAIDDSSPAVQLLLDAKYYLEQDYLNGDERFRGASRMVWLTGGAIASGK